MKDASRQHFSDRDKGEARQAIERCRQFGQVLDIDEADEPILAAPVRAAIYEWLVEIRARDELAAAKCSPRRSALLYGPPGTGKTTLAHHLAARLGVPLIAVRSEMLVDKYVGSTGRNIAALFENLDLIGERAVVLFDEIDAIGSTRGEFASSAGKERNSFLTTLLTRVETCTGFMLAATNRKEAIDSALWRRFGMQIDVALPAYEERYAICARYLDPFVLDEGALAVVAEAAEGASPSLLRQLMEGVKRALILAPRLKRDASSPAAVFWQVIRQVAPPPEFEPPPLWTMDEAHFAKAIGAMAWPPARKGGGA